MKLNLIPLLFVFASYAFAQIPPQDVHAAIREAGGVESYMQASAQQLSENLPMQISKNRVLTGVMAAKKTFRFVFHIPSVYNRKSVQDMDALKASFINFTPCSTPRSSILIRDYEARFVYVMLSKNGEFLSEHELNSNTCKGRYG